MRAVLLCLAGLAAGIGLFLYGGTMDARSSQAGPLVFAGIGAALISLAMLIVSWRSSRRRDYAAAVRSTDAVARWQVYPSDMEAFRRVDSARSGRLWSLKNLLKFPDSVPLEGFPIVVGEKSLLFGDKLYSYGLEEFGEAGEICLQPGFLEISCYLKTTKAPLINVLRIPVPAAAREQAERAFEHLQGQIKPQGRERLRRTFHDHFEAAEQSTDAPHRLQRRRKVVIPLLALFILALAAFLLYSVVLRPRTPLVPNEPFPALPEAAAPHSDPAYPPLANEVAPRPANEADPGT
jgi:hypothetical protein